MMKGIAGLLAPPLLVQLPPPLPLRQLRQPVVARAAAAVAAARRRGGEGGALRFQPPYPVAPPYPPPAFSPRLMSTQPPWCSPPSPPPLSRC